MQIKNLVLIILSLSVIAMYGCKQDGPTKSMVGGYEYVIHEKGDGPKIQPGDYISFTMKIMDNTGKVYQDNHTEPLPTSQIPAEGDPAATPNPFIDMLAEVSVGDSVELMMPRDSLKQLPPGTDDLQVLSYVVRVVKAQDEASYQAEVAEQQAADAAKAEVIIGRTEEVAALVASIGETIDDGSAKIASTDTGLKYIIHEEGTGAQPQAGDMVSVLYYGTLENGDEFDNAFKRGKEFTFTVDQRQVIAGWDEGLKLLKEGGKATLIVPPSLGYGDRANGGIPANSTLRFYVELVKVN
jgi:FKBP-type peptidyl-prolyl cis-trans isomerase FkpA